MRTRSYAGLACLLLTAGACSSPSTSSTESQSTATTSSAQWTPPTLDLGATDPTQVVTVSIIFKVKSLPELEGFVRATGEPGWGRHRFLSVSDFADHFAPSTRDIARVSAYLTTFGIQVGATLADRLVLKATGTVGAFTQAFNFQMHDFQRGRQHFHRPSSAPRIPGSIADVMLVVTGFSNQPAFVPKVASVKALAPALAPKVVLPQNGTATGTPGSFTTGDFANQYNVNPLYQAGVDGTGSTIGIATLAGFDPADAYNYWSSIGLNVRQDRITQVHVDNGAPIGADAGSGETALDVEQSGGVAPNANVVVYDAPNTDGGFLDVFYTAVSDNVVDSLSVSWGEAEVFYNAALAGTDLGAELNAFHQVFLEGAAQGISMFAASGDSGAYDTSGIVPGLSDALTVDIPAADPAITAAGGTTTPYSFTFGTATFNVTQEQVWGWDGLQAFFNANGSSYNLFSTGSGGGVSTFWAAPYYQQGVPGIRRSEAGQVITYTDSTGTSTLLTLPASYAGRNVPDVSADADPFSGYLLYSTPDGGWNAGYGGTSFVAPQLNGVAALVRQRSGGRTGLWNPALYRLSQRHNGGIVDVTGGDNWFYAGVRGYEPATGVGVLDVSAFANAMSHD